MKKSITPQQQSYINSLMKKRMEKQKEKLFIKEQDKERIWTYQEENYLCKDGRTCLERQIEEIKINSK